MSTTAENPDIDPDKAYQSTTLPEFKTQKQELDEGAEKRVDEMGEYDPGMEDGIVSSRAVGENGGSIIKDLKQKGESLKRRQEILLEFEAMEEQEMDGGRDNHEERGKSCEEHDIAIGLVSKFTQKENEGRCEGDEPGVFMEEKLNRWGDSHDNEENGQDRVETTTTDVLTKLSQENDRELNESQESGAEGGDKMDEGSSEQEKQETERVVIDTITDRALSLEPKALKRGRHGDERTEDVHIFASGDEENGLIEVRKKSKIQEEDCRMEISENKSSKTESQLEEAESSKPAVKVKEELKEKIETVKINTEQKTTIQQIENSSTDVKIRPSVKVLQGLFLFDPVKKIKMNSKYSLCWNQVKCYDAKQYPHLKGVVRCNLCNKGIVAANKGGGVNIRNHLISKHPEKYLELYPEGFMDENTSKHGKNNVAARVRQKKRDKSATLNLHDGVGKGGGVNSPIVHTGASVGGGASNVNERKFYDISQSAAAAVAQAQAQAASMGFKSFWGVGGWNMTQAAAAGNAQPLAQHFPQHNNQQLAQRNSHHNSQNHARNHNRSTAEQYHIQLHEPMSRKTDATKARSPVRVRDEENNSSSDEKSKTQDEKWMELWDHTRLLLNQLRKEYKEETNGDVRGELERDMHKLKVRKAQFENFLGMDT